MFCLCLTVSYRAVHFLHVSLVYLLYIKQCIFSILLDYVSFIKVSKTPKRFVTLWAHIKQNQTLSWGLEWIFYFSSRIKFLIFLFLLFTNLRAVSLAIFFYRSQDNLNGSHWTLILFQENFLIQKQNHKDKLRAQVLNSKS